MKKNVFIISFILLCFCFLEIKAQTINITATLDTNKILIGDQTQLHLKIKQNKNQIIYWPQIDKINDSIEIIKQSNIDTVFTPNSDEIELNQNLTITSFETGLIPIPSFEFKYDVINDSTYKSLQTNILYLNVNTVKVNLEKDIADIKPIIEEPWRWREIIPVLIIILVVVIVLLIGLYIWWRIKNHKPVLNFLKKPPIPAHIIATEQLNILKSKKLWQTGQVKEYFSDLTDIMRTYMENRMNFGAMEMVSEDIIKELNKDLNISSELLTITKEVLQIADVVKFAKIQTLATENELALKWAYKFIDETKEDNNKNEEEIK